MLGLVEPIQAVGSFITFLAQLLQVAVEAVAVVLTKHQQVLILLPRQT
jgi:hypothetical protein